mmetsp:Transcript_1579/g.2399  ORF Transcript_1579/g.2399 Transcript_1579/m.2399 type:complete len:105 (-) Transcript_1579:1004-1318(-)
MLLRLIEPHIWHSVMPTAHDAPLQPFALQLASDALHTLHKEKGEEIALSSFLLREQPSLAPLRRTRRTLRQLLREHLENNYNLTKSLPDNTNEGTEEGRGVYKS